MMLLLVAGVLTVCVPEPLLEVADISQWQYRTKVDGRPEKCWYVGKRMKPRNELTWASSDPQIGPEPSAAQPGADSSPPAPVLTPFEERWKGDLR